MVVDGEGQGRRDPLVDALARDAARQVDADPHGERVVAVGKRGGVERMRKEEEEVSFEPLRLVQSEARRVLIGAARVHAPEVLCGR